MKHRPHSRLDSVGSHLVFLQGRVTGAHYIVQVDNNALLQQDNVYPLTAAVSKIPSLFSTSHVCDKMKWDLALSTEPAKTIVLASKSPTSRM